MIPRWGLKKNFEHPYEPIMDPPQSHDAGETLKDENLEYMRG